MSSYMPESKSDTHLTPDRVWWMIENKWNYKREEMFDPCPVWCIWDGLQINWEKINFVNPPYTLLKEFVAKAVEETKKGNITIMLLPAKTDQDWFHFDIIANGYEPQWIHKRLKFKNHKSGATQPHFLVMVD